MALTTTDLERVLSDARLSFWASIRAEPFSHLPDLYAERERQGLYPDFAAANDHRRWDPRAHLPNVRSILTVMVPVADLSYASKSFQETRIDPDIVRSRVFGRVSRYAWGADYHDVLPWRLEQVAKTLQRQGYIHEYFLAVDTTPLPDRELVVRAGMASFAWNSCVYGSEHGSHYVLGSLLVDKPLPEKQGTSPSILCGSLCQRCLAACPTGALIAPFVLDSRRCLAYITQASGPFPRQYRKALGARIWGCDTCQNCCPMNHPSKRNHEEIPKAQPTVTEGNWWDVTTILQWSKQDFDKACRGTALHWRGKNTLQRNAAIVLGNIGSKAHTPLLLNTIDHHPAPVVRASALWSLAQLDQNLGKRQAQEILLKTEDPLVVEEAVYVAQLEN